ncbi:hypothetical protein SCANM63S_05404 [Streptomyces canarius]
MLDQDLLRAARLAGYGTVSTQLSLLSDHRLGEAVAAATPLGSGIGGRSAELDINGIRVFVKRIPLTDTELRPENVRSTANVFELPMFYQYGVGSAGFGAWRELAVHTMTTNWALGHHVLVHVEGAQCQDPASGQRAGQLLGRADPVQDGHPDVHHHDVGAQPLGEHDGLRAVLRLAHHLEGGVRREDQRQAAPDQRLVVRDEDPDPGRHGRHRYTACPRSPPSTRSVGSPLWTAASAVSSAASGSSATTAKPPSGRGPASRVPPCRATRSRMPMRP